MKSIIILGGNELHKGFEDWKKKADVQNIYVFDWNRIPAYTGDMHIQVDIKMVNEVMEKVDQLPEKDIYLVYTSADIAVPTQVQIHNKLGLLHPAEEAIWNTIEKTRCTELWRQAGLLNRDSHKLADISEMNDLLFDTDIIIKPNVGSGSRGITILKRNDINTDNMIAAYERAQSCSQDNCVILEEFLLGTEYTVEMLGDDYGNVSVYGISKKYHSKYITSNKIATKLHYNPNDVSDDLLNKIAESGQLCYKALGLKNSFGHLEIMVTEDGRISPLEMGARSSGYIATHCLDAINESNFLLDYGEVIRGKKVTDGIVFKRDQSSMYYFYDIKPGISRKEINIMEYCRSKIESICFNRDKLKKGMQFSKINEDAERFGYEILIGKRDEMTINAVNDMEERFVKDFIGEEEEYGYKKQNN